MAIFVIAFLVISTAFIGSNGQTNGTDSNNGALSLLGESAISDNLASLYSMSKNFQPPLNNSSAYDKVVSAAWNLLNFTNFNAYHTSLGQRALFQWGVSYNFSSSNLSLYFQLDFTKANFTTVYTWGANNHWIMTTPNVSDTPTTYYSQAPGTSNSSAGDVFYNYTNQILNPLEEVQATIPVATITSPPSDQITGNYMGVGAWIGLEPQSASVVAQTGYYREYYNNNQIGSDYWHHYHIWYEYAPEYGSTVYPGSPDLTPGWYIDFSVGYDNPGFTYTASIRNTSQGYVATTSGVFFTPVFAYSVVEAPSFKDYSTGKLFISQIGEFSEVNFYLGLTESNNWYATWLLQQDSNGPNTQEGFGSNNGWGYYPYVVWLNSYYSWSYVNP